MTDDPEQSTVQQAAELVANAEALLITAGAGMSVDSGLPDYRGATGLWRGYPPLAKLGLSFEQMAQPHWFEHDPEMAWAWYGHRQQLYREATPHAGYGILRRWAQAMRMGAFVVTSNVDGQFEAAGFPARGLFEQHGNIHRYQCTRPCREDTWERDPPDLRIDLDELRARGELPRCPHCNELARPNVLMFNDWAWVDVISRQQHRRFEEWLARIEGQRLVVLEIGAGMSVGSIRALSSRLARRERTDVVRINPDDSAEDSVLRVRLSALQALQEIELAFPREREGRNSDSTSAEPLESRQT